MVAELELNTITPRSFWKDHISRRQPALINGTDKSWDSFTDELLLSKAGDVTVMVEHRSSSKDSYGQGRKSPMLLCQFIQAMQQGNSTLYLSTQEVGVGRDGHPLLCGAPLVQLVGDFPLQQPLMGHLVPQSINMWMGCAPEGSSSGLHHDYHDNLYVLLRGCKHFRLYPPGTAPDMYVNGTLKKIYPNGRIVYEGQGDIMADGSDKHDVALWKARHDADEAAAAAADPNQANAADELLEQQLAHMLDEGAEFEDGQFADDYVDSDEPADLPSSSEDGWEHGCEETARMSDRTAASAPANKRHKGLSQQQQQQQQQPRIMNQQSKKQRQGQGKQNTNGGKAATAAAADAGAIPSFSQVDLSLPELQLRRQFPRFPGLASAVEVLLQAGQMLYLPAGWFHEVTSFAGGGLDGGHLAINYWYHPPDNLDPSKAGYKQPYTSQYYPTIWQQRLPRLQQETQHWWQQQQQQLAKAAAGVGWACAAQPSAIAAAADGGLPQHLHVRTGGRHVVWQHEVHTPPNRYRMSMTREGTATGGAGKTPVGSQPGNRPCCGVIDSPDSDGGSDTDSPCSREPADALTHNSVAAKQQKSQQAKPQKGKDQHSKQQQQQQLEIGPSGHRPQAHGSDECSMRHAAAASQASRGARAGAGSEAAAAAADGFDDDDANLSEEVRAGIAAVEDYFSDNPEAARALLAEYMAQRRRRLASSAGAQKRTIGLPRLFGRRHHYSIVVKVVPRTPGRR